MARKFGAGPAVAVGLTALAPVALFLSWWEAPLLSALTVEDGVVEYVTAALYLVAAISLFATGFGRAARKVWILPLGAACFFVAGEEVSWGQRIVGLATPTALAELNVQGEANLHNIAGIHGSVRGAGVIVLLTLFALLPLAAHYLSSARGLVDRLGFPLPPLMAAFLVVLGVGFMAGPRIIRGETLFAFDEVGELYVAAAWLLFAMSIWTRTVTTETPNRLAFPG